VHVVQAPGVWALAASLIEAQNSRRINAAGYNTMPANIWNGIDRAPLVVLDEIGCRDAVSDFRYETTKRVIDARRGKPLVCISNLSLGELVGLYDDRISSRLAEGTVFCLDGDDRRLKQHLRLAETA
jgi:DNA replication protein DnaC